MRHPSIYQLTDRVPAMAADAYATDQSIIVGDVVIGSRSSVWFGAVIRGDNGAVRIGGETNVQDCAVVHGLPGERVEIGTLVSIGHGAIVHGCAIGDRCLIGMQSLLMDGVEVGEDTIVAARALLTKGKKYPGGVLLMGAPAVVARELTPRERDFIKTNAREYVERAALYHAALARPLG